MLKKIKNPFFAQTIFGEWLELRSEFIFENTKCKTFSEGKFKNIYILIDPKNNKISYFSFALDDNLFMNVSRFKWRTIKIKWK